LFDGNDVGCHGFKNKDKGAYISSGGAFLA
jgi:hypothetical protein